jgi:hypothetical protein
MEQRVLFSSPTIKLSNRNTSDTTALSIAFGNQGQKLPLVRDPSIFDVTFFFTPGLMVTHVSTTYSETGMAQANMDGDVAEPDPMVLMRMIRTVASFRGYVLQRTRAPMHVSMRTQTTGDRVSCFLMFLCALLSVSGVE